MEVIKEEVYQKVKKELNKEGDYFTEEEITYLTEGLKRG